VGLNKVQGAKATPPARQGAGGIEQGRDDLLGPDAALDDSTGEDLSSVYRLDGFADFGPEGCSGAARRRRDYIVQEQGVCRDVDT